MKKNYPAYIICEDSITMVINGKPYSVNSQHPNFNAIKARIKDEQFEDIQVLFDRAEAIRLAAHGAVVIRDDAIYYKDKQLHGHIVDRILQFAKEGLPFKPLMLFLENLMNNPSYRAVTELYGFLEKSTLPITDDGCFLAYRKVTTDYKDFYTRTIDNSIGKTVEMERNLVNEDKNQTCSYGLHFCSQSYLSKYHGGEGRVVIVKINPADVVAIPADYNNAKGRCCKYVVLSECEEKENGKTFGPLFNCNTKSVNDLSSGSVSEGKLADCEEFGFQYGANDYKAKQPRDAQKASRSAEEGQKSVFCYREITAFTKGYHAGYDYHKTSSDSAKQEGPDTTAKTKKLSAAAKMQKRDSKGRFI